MLVVALLIMKTTDSRDFERNRDAFIYKHQAFNAKNVPWDIPKNVLYLNKNCKEFF